MSRDIPTDGDLPSREPWRLVGTLAVSGLACASHSSQKPPAPTWSLVRSKPGRNSKSPLKCPIMESSLAMASRAIISPSTPAPSPRSAWQSAGPILSRPHDGKVFFNLEKARQKVLDKSQTGWHNMWAVNASTITCKK